MLEKQEKRYKRHKRVRAKISGTVKVPRLCVFRSNKHIYAQLIDDGKGKILIAASDLEIKPFSAKASASAETSAETSAGKAKTVIAHEVGKLIAEKAKEKKIKKVTFDRGGYKYHGRVKALAEGARKGGLEF